ncbi:hypothetical protein BLA24_29260 [Streptomyces cinnamoneus]|uniref:Uncharacterized protein n=1 Tax=Streptomyces cinnamoneus TaxID=53446 RepID=A0A2G1XB48_STRCJ|nr:hypothetical protein [Streptomyces cinnamoneus]PHQ48458.1 hypothetical protein BLA24_29260 [Streptomyces cinnamoneus]PPT12547.1 hypothetical protein CYQ11_06215 [Streptomyces cinnamoneus]
MPENESQALVIVDAEDNYYVLPREAVEMARAAPEARAVIEEHLGGSEKVPLAGGYAFVGVLTLPGEAEMAHYTPEVAWPVATTS